MQPVNQDSDGQSENRGKVDKRPKLMAFLRKLLDDSHYSHLIEWSSQKSGVFRILDKVVVSKLWGAGKNKPNMNYESFSRALRFHYKQGTLRKAKGLYCYQFISSNK